MGMCSPLIFLSESFSKCCGCVFLLGLYSSSSVLQFLKQRKLQDLESLFSMTAKLRIYCKIYQFYGSDQSRNEGGGENIILGIISWVEILICVIVWFVIAGGVGAIVLDSPFSCLLVGVGPVDLLLWRESILIAVCVGSHQG